MKVPSNEAKEIRKNILIPVALVFFFLLILLIASLYWLQQKHISKTVEHEANVVQELYLSLINREALLMTSLLQSYGENPELRKAFLAKDRGRLLEIYTDTLSGVRTKDKITHFAFLEQDGKVLLRAHLPEKYGDYPYHFDLLHETVHPGKIFTTTVIGIKGVLVQRVLSPWYVDGKLIGFLGHAKGIGQIAAELKTILGTDLIFISKKSLLNQTQIKQRLAQAGKIANWDQFSDTIILDSTLPAVPGELIDKLAHSTKWSSSKLFRITAENKHYACKVSQLKNPDGSYMADVVLLNDITLETAKLKRLALLLTFAALCSGVLLFIFFYTFTGRIQNRLVAAHDELQNEISQRKQTEQALQRANETLEDKVAERTTSLQDVNRELQASADRFQRVMDSIDSLVYVADMETYEILFLNKYGRNIWGDITGKVCWQTLQSGQDGPCSFCTNKYLVDENKNIRPVHVWEFQNSVTGDWFECRDQAIHWPDGRVVRMEIATNINQRKEDEAEKNNLQSQLLQAQKMESVGRLTGGVAHDFNNLLTAIIGYSDLALLELGKDHSSRKNIEAIYSAGKKAANVVRQLLAFSRKQVLQMEVVNLNSVLENATKIFGRIIGEDIAVELLTSDKIGNIEADPGQLEQIILNLAVNARDAMPDGGKLIIETSSVFLDESYAKKHADVTPGTYTMLSVTDTGEGMSADVKDKVFDPFFTTKERGKGTGLGLATVYGIVKQHRSHIFIYSEPGIGTTFKIYFPQVDDTTKPVVAEKKKTMPGGSETILVVDDDQSVRKLLVTSLTSLGYTVLEAEDGRQAIDISEATSEPIDLLLTDVIMPQMNGRELATHLQAKQPGLKVIFISGYTDDVIVKQGVLECGIVFISKPLMPTELATKIRMELDR